MQVYCSTPLGQNNPYTFRINQWLPCTLCVTLRWSLCSWKTYLHTPTHPNARAQLSIMTYVLQQNHETQPNSTWCERENTRWQRVTVLRAGGSAQGLVRVLLCVAEEEDEVEVEVAGVKTKRFRNHIELQSKPMRIGTFRATNERSRS